MGGLLAKAFGRATGATADEIAFKGVAADAAIGGGLTAGGVDVPGRDGPSGAALDALQIVEGGQTVALSGAIATGLYGFGATASSAGGAVIFPVGFAALGGYVIADGFNSLFERYTGDSPGTYLYELLNSSPCF